MAAAVATAAPLAIVGVPSPVPVPVPATLAAGLRDCRLIQGPVAISAQLVLLVVVVTALSVKRTRISRMKWPPYSPTSFSPFQLKPALFLTCGGSLLELGAWISNTQASQVVLKASASLSKLAARRPGLTQTKTEAEKVLSTHEGPGCTWHRERPRRPLNIWLLDVGKQACSAGAGHSVGMLIAIIVHGRTGQGSECGWYFIVYFCDCTLGLTLAISFHKLTTGVARWLHTRSLASKEYDEEHPWWESLVDSGHYGDQATPNMRKWAVQVAAWVLCVISARSIVGALILTFAAAFTAITSSLDSRFVGRPDVYLYTVMVAIPLVVNVGQAWIIDVVLKLHHRKGHVLSDKMRDRVDEAVDAEEQATGRQAGAVGAASVPFNDPKRN